MEDGIPLDMRTKVIFSYQLVEDLLVRRRNGIISEGELKEALSDAMLRMFSSRLSHGTQGHIFELISPSEGTLAARRDRKQSREKLKHYAEIPFDAKVSALDLQETHVDLRLRIDTSHREGGVPGYSDSTGFFVPRNTLHKALRQALSSGTAVLAQLRILKKEPDRPDQSPQKSEPVAPAPLWPFAKRGETP